jgi:hypothetical protein
MGLEPNIPPICVVSSPSDNDIISGTISITGTASDSDGNVLSVEVEIDSGSWNPATGTTSWSYSLDTTTLSDGDHTIFARSYDGENYSTIVSVIVKVNNVNEAPTVIVMSISDGTEVSGATNISGTASDPDGDSELVNVEVKIDSGTWQNATGTTSWIYELDTTSLSNGQHSLYFRSYDGAEYSSIKQLNVTVNNDGDGENGTTTKSLFEELWFWAVIIIVIVALIIAILIIMRKKKGKKPVESEPSNAEPPPPPDL